MQPLSNSNGVLITPGNIRNLASFISPSATIGEGGICFGRGRVDNELLLSVPLASAGEISPYASLQITVGLDATTLNTRGRDTDIVIGLSDNVNSNTFWVVDVNNFQSYSPCYLIDGSHENTRVTGPASGQFTFHFEPFHKFGACYTAQNSGYVNAGKFAKQLDLHAKGLYLIVKRNHAQETYRFHYFKVEVTK